MLLFELEPDGIILGVRDVREALGHAHDEEDCCVDAHRDAGIAFFNLDECRSADGGTLGHDGRRDAPPPPGVPNVPAQLRRPRLTGIGSATDARLVLILSVYEDER